MLTEADHLPPADRQAETPSRPTYGLGQVHVIDDLPSDRLEPPCSFQTGTAEEDAAPRGGGGASLIDPPHGVEQVEEEQEGRDQQALSGRIGAEPGHTAVEVQSPTLALRHQPAQGAGLMPDVGVGEEQ